VVGARTAPRPAASPVRNDPVLHLHLRESRPPSSGRCWPASRETTCSRSRTTSESASASRRCRGNRSMRWRDLSHRHRLGSDAR